MASSLEIGAFTIQELSRIVARRLRRGPTRPGWSWRVEITRGVIYALLMRSKEKGVPWLREAQARLVGPSERQRACRFEPLLLGGVPCEWCVPAAATPGRTVVYLHGGGYVIGGVATYREHLARIATDAGARVLGVDYRRAPEHPFPAQQDDCLAVTREVLAEAPPETVALAGDSAGGALAVATLCALRDAGEALPAAAVLLSPWVDPLASGGSMEENARFDFGDRELLVGWAEQTLAGADAYDPRFCVLEAKLEGLPPLLIQVGGAEILLDQVLAFVARARDAEVPVTLEVAPDMFHIWQVQAAMLPEGAEAMDAVGRFLRAQLVTGAA